MSGAAWAATAAAALAALLFPRPSARSLAARRLGGHFGRGPERHPTAVRAGGRGRAVAWFGAAILAALGALGALWWNGVVGLGLIALPAIIVALGLWFRASRLRRARDAEVGRSACEAYEAMAADLRAGRSPAQALHSAAAVLPALTPAAAAAALGDDVPAALHRIELPGRQGTRELATAWAVAETGGAGLATVIDRFAAGMREDWEIRDEVRAALAAPRSTARVLAALPLAGVALGYATGAAPLAFLLGTPAGMACMVAGVGLAFAGLAWVERLARSAEE